MKSIQEGLKRKEAERHFFDNLIKQEIDPLKRKKALTSSERRFLILYLKLEDIAENLPTDLTPEYDWNKIE